MLAHSRDVWTKIVCIVTRQKSAGTVGYLYSFAVFDHISGKCFVSVILAQWRKRNSGTPGQISKSSPPSRFPTLSPLSAASLPRTLHLLPIPPVPFSSLHTPSRPFLPPSSLSLLFPTLFFPFPPSHHLVTARGLGSARAPPAGQGGALPPNAFLRNSQPKMCKCARRSYGLLFGSYMDDQWSDRRRPVLPHKRW